MADYAVVVGVARYPQLSADGVPTDLEGPSSDAQAVHDWLVDPQGGRLDPNNVKLIRSAQFDPLDPADPQPTAAKIEQNLKWIEQQTRDTAGDRLYLYFSGHGFAPALEEGALFTAEATQISPEYVYAHSWLRWFRKAQRFRESVLWMDCCMNYQQSIPVNEVVMRARIGTAVLGPAFVALAAQTKNALEHVMPDGQVHGVFTWTLLKGLEGGASDERGRVTGESLRAFLHNAMPEFLPEDVKEAAAVDLQPFVRADDGLVFQRLLTRPKHRVHLTLSAAVAGQELKVWTGRPYAQVVSEALAGEEWTGSLVRGLYVAEVPAAGLRQGFQVSGAGDLDLVIDQHGPTVTPPSDSSELFSLKVVADNPAATIVVIDHRFERIFTDTGQLHEREAPGVYKIRVQFGRDIKTVSEEVLLLDRDRPAHPTATPPLPSPAPIQGSALTHEHHVELFIVAADRPFIHPRRLPTTPVMALPTISVMARYWTAPEHRQAQLVFGHPMEGLDLLDARGAPIARLSEGSQVDGPVPVDPVAVWEGEVPPGVYFLRQSLRNGGTFEGTVVVSPDWVTQVAIRRAATDGGSDSGSLRVSLIDDVAIFMRAAGGTSPAPEQDAVIEGARLALTQGRNLFGEGHGSQLQQLLLWEYEDPIAGIIGSHLLLRAMDAEPVQDTARATQFDSAVARLRELVPEHPDVAALSLRCADAAMRVTQPFTAPPMFSHSWQLITDATYGEPELVPVELWQRVHASTSIGPFFVWAADDSTRAAHAYQLSQWMRNYGEDDAPDASTRAPSRGAAMPHLGSAELSAGEGPLPDVARDAARRLHIPAAAAAVLWGSVVWRDG